MALLNNRGGGGGAVVCGRITNRLDSVSPPSSMSMQQHCGGSASACGTLKKTANCERERLAVARGSEDHYDDEDDDQSQKGKTEYVSD